MDDSSLADLVFFTEDIAVPPNVGCDAISVGNTDSGDMIHLGRQRPSPGRLAALTDMSLVMATPSQSGISGDDGSEDNGLYALFRSATTADGWDDTWLRGDEVFTQLGGLAFTPDGTWLLVTTQVVRGQCPEVQPSGLLPYAVSKYRVDQIDLSGHHVGPEVGRIELAAPVAEILVAEGGTVAHLVTAPQSLRALESSPAVVTIDVNSMRETASRIPLALSGDLGRSGCGSSWDPIGVTHATLSPDERYLVTNRWLDGELNVANLVSRTSWTIDLQVPRDSFTGGVAFNHGWINHGLLAIHHMRGIGIYGWSDGKSLTELAKIAVPPPMEVREGKIYGSSGINTGPPASLAWSGSGDAVIASINTTGVPEFRSWSVLDGVRHLEVAHDYTVCRYPDNFQNDILTGNALLPTRTPTVTASAPPSITPSPTTMPTLTATNLPPTSSPTPTSSATHTRTATARPSSTPAPINLPLLLTESCTPTERHIDVALVLDASTSMRDPTTTGRSKLAAATEAARTFLDQLRFAAGDQAAIVTFNADAVLAAPLTTDRAALDAALTGIQTAQYTRIDRGIAVARAELTGTRRNTVNTPVLILLTDGRANPVPVSVAEAEARAAKDAGVVLFTIGLGTDLDDAALAAMASRPEYYHVAADAEQLAGIYRAIAVTIPCPAGAFWGAAIREPATQRHQKVA